MSTLNALLAGASAAIVAGVTGSRESSETIHTIQTPGRSPVHLEIAVGRTGSTPLQQAQRVSEGLSERHTLVVIGAFQLASKDRPTSIGLAADFGDDIRAAMLASAWASALACRITYTGTTEQPGPDGWVWIVQTYNALQTVSLS